MRLPRWKKEQREKKRQKLATKMRFLGVAIVLGLLIFAILSFLKIYTTSVLPKNGRTTIVYDTLPVKILSYDQSGKVVSLEIPANVYLESVHGYGQYKLGSLYALGKMEKKGGELLAGSMQEFLGVPIDGWGGRETNLNIWDRFCLWWKISSTKSNLRQTIDLSKIGIFTKNILPDNSVGLTVNPAKLDAELAGIFKDSGIVAEHLTIEVLNASGKPEMANRAARLIANLGGTVISVGNSEKESDRCLLKAEPRIFRTFTSLRLKEIYNCQEMPSSSLDSRADLQLTIGLAYWQKLNQK